MRRIALAIGRSAAVADLVAEIPVGALQRAHSCSWAGGIGQRIDNRPDLAALIAAITSAV